MNRLAWAFVVVLLSGWLAQDEGWAADPARLLPVSAHNCYPSRSANNAKLLEALNLGIDNIEIDLGWDDRTKELIVGHDAAPRGGVIYPEFEAYLVPALEAHWKTHPRGQAPTVLTIDWKTEKPEAVTKFKAFLDLHADWFSSAPKTEDSPLTNRNLTVCFTGSDVAKDAYDALIPARGTYRAFRDRVFGQGAKFEPDVASYVPTKATAYHRFLTFHWGVVEQGGPALARDWTKADANRLSALMTQAHQQGFRARFYCLNGHTGTLVSGYQFTSDEAAKVRWLAAVQAGVDWIATDEYREIAEVLGAKGIPVSFRVADLNVGETEQLTLGNGSTAEVRLVRVEAATDPIRNAVRGARVTLAVNGRSVTIGTGNYELPRRVGAVQVDCPVISAYNQNSTEDHWGLVKAARIRLWPAYAPWIEPGTFVFPARQKWLASMTQMANEPVYVDGGEVPGNPKIYYHSGLDIGGAEGLVEVIAATDGQVASSGIDRLANLGDAPVDFRGDVVYIRDGRGWYYRYSHLKTIEPTIKPGATVKMGQKLGLLGKEGGSGGWSHLHFEIKSQMPSGKWGTQEGYAFLWQAAIREQDLNVVAVARPHRFARVGETVVLDGSKSWTLNKSAPQRYEWTFTDGKTADTPTVEHVYDAPGEYSEILKVTDAAGHVGYDFAVVQIIDSKAPDVLSPTIHAAYFPTTDLKPGAEVTFKARTFRVGNDGGSETVDFGDGTPKVTVKSDGNAVQHAPEGYAVFKHRFEKPGHFLVRIDRATRAGIPATTRLHVRVDEP